MRMGRKRTKLRSTTRLGEGERYTMLDREEQKWEIGVSGKEVESRLILGKNICEFKSKGRIQRAWGEAEKGE